MDQQIIALAVLTEDLSFRSWHPCGNLHGFHNSYPRGSGILFCPPEAPGTQAVHLHAGKTTCMHEVNNLETTPPSARVQFMAVC